MPKSVAIAPVLHQVGGPRHVLHPAGDQAVSIAGADRLCGERNGLEPAAAHLVDGCGRDTFGEPGADRRLTRGVLTETRLEHVAHQNLVDAVDARATQRFLDSDRAEPGGRNVDECTAEGPHRCAHRADDDRSFHVRPLYARVCDGSGASEPNVAT